MANNPTPPPGFVPVGSAPPPPPAGFVPADQAQPQAQTNAPSQSDEIQINPSDNLATKAGKAALGTFEGIGEGVFGTAAGASDLIDKATGMNPGAVNAYLHTEAGDNDTSHGLPQTAGRGIETLMEFVLGDEALKGLSVSQRLLKASKLAKTVEESPMLSRVFQAGVRALRGGAVGTVQGGLKTGDVPDALGAGAAGAIGNAVVPEAFDAAKAAPEALGKAADVVRKVIKPGTIQDAFQGQVRAIINDAAQEFGVNPSASASIRDVAKDVSDALQAKAKSAYQALDDAIGGRAQRFTDAIKNVQAKIRELNGIDPDQEGAFVEKLNDLQEAHEKAMSEADQALKEQGKGQTAKGLLEQANSDFRKSKAMLDLSKQIRASAEGLRPELASGAKTPIPEKLNTGKLTGRVNKMYDSGRLQDALGERSKAFLQALNDSHVASQTAQAWSQLMKRGARYAAYGALPFGGYEMIRHLLGE